MEKYATKYSIFGNYCQVFPTGAKEWAAKPSMPTLQQNIAISDRLWYAVKLYRYEKEV